MPLTRIGSIGINTGIKFSGLTTITTLNTSIDALSIGGPVSIAGTLTYEDVTNIDSVGLVTARNGIVVGSGITLSKDGDVFFTGIATGNGSGLTALNASNLGSGTVPTARLGSGTASSSTFLRGDSTFAAVTVAINAIGNDGSDRVLTSDGDGTATAESNLTFDGSALGINNSSPAYPLDVVGDGGGSFSASTNSTNGVLSVVGKNSSGSVSAISRIKSYPDGSSNQSHMAFETRNSSNTMVERLRIDSSGNVMIGTTSSTVYDDSSGSGVVVRGSTGAVDIMRDNDVCLFLNRNTGDGQMMRMARAGTSKADISLRSDTLCFDVGSSGSERVRIDSNGQVGINDTSPDAELSVAAVSGNAPHIDIGQAGGNRFKLGYEGNNCFLGASSSTGMFVFKNNVTADGHPQADGTEKMRLDNGGRLLVGRTNYITVGGDASDHCFEQITNNGYALTVHSDTANQRGIGVYYPDNSNTAQVAFAFQIGSSFKTIIRDDGDLENANNNYGSISDVSMKENIVDANSQWDDIKNIKIRNYNFKESTGQQTHKQIGVIAQELETVCPNLVDVTRETGKKNVAYSVLYVKAIKALQESMTRIETLEAEVAALKSS